MTALFIVCGIILFILLLLVLPVCIYLEFKDEFNVSVKYAGIKVFSTSGKKEEKPEKVEEKPQMGEAKEKEEQKKENKLLSLFKKKKEQDGTLGAIKYFGGFAKSVLKKLIWFLKKLKFDHIKLNLSISSDEAADTAVLYGTVCSVLYPILSLITSNSSVKYKEINVSADFNKTAIVADFSMCVNLRLIYAVIVFLKVYSEYRKMIKEEDKK